MRLMRMFPFPALIVAAVVLLMAAGCGGGTGSSAVSGLSSGESGGISAETGSIYGNVTDSRTGALQEGATVTLVSLSKTTDSTGSYSLSGIAPGTYTLSATKSGYNQYSSTVRITAGGQLQANIALVPRSIAVSAALNGAVRDADTGALLEGVTVKASDVTRVTSADGTYTFDALPAGSVTVTAEKEGYYQYEVVVDLGGGENQTEDIDLLKESSPTPSPTPTSSPTPTPSPGGGTVKNSVLQGTVTNVSSRKALQGASVKVGSLSATTDSKGFYRIMNIQPGNITVSVTMSGYYAKSQSVTLRSGEQRDLDFPLTETTEEWLENSTKYSWQVDVVKNDGTTESGSEWSFTTNPAGTKSSRAMAQRVIPAVKTTVSSDEAVTIARSQLRKDGRKNEHIESLHCIFDREGAHHLAYVAVLSPRGYVVVPAVKLGVYPPVLACSYNTDFSFSRSPGNELLSLVRNDIALRIIASDGLKVKSGSQADKNLRLWESYLKGDMTARDEEEPQQLMKFATWNQEPPYNDNCPSEGTAKCPTGCTATALAQLFNFWMNPVTLTFTDSDSYKTLKTQISVNAPSASFTSINYNNGSPSDKVKAQVSFACGVMVRMGYAAKSSEASLKISAKALETKCGFPYASYVDIEKDSDAYIKILKDNIAGGRPVLVGVKQPDTIPDASGHAIVCDGYDSETGNFHLNMGWGSTSDGWYSLPTDIPDDLTIVDDLIEKVYKSSDTPSRPAKPQNPNPSDGDNNVYNNAYLYWDTCSNAKSYNVYLWKDSDEKPSSPTFSGLPYAITGPEYRQ